eukprot:SAG31_NODE_17513_length_668_cov_0.729350_1_plen_20_part_10
MSYSIESGVPDSNAARRRSM